MNKRDVIKSLIIALFNNWERRIAFAEWKYIYEVNINRIEKTDWLRWKEFISVIKTRIK